MAWLTGYGYRKKKPVNATAAGAQTDFQVRLLVGESSGAAGEEIDCESHCQDFPNDIRFTGADEISKHSYWVESITGVTPNRLATIWIEVVTIPAAGSVDLYMYYGKVSDSGQSDGGAAFMFFDDFVDPTVINLIDEPTNPTRVADDAWEGTQINEQSDFHHGGEYISWYRGHGAGTYEVGFEDSDDGIVWSPYSGNPIISTPSVYIYVVQDGNNFYLFVNTDSDGYGSIYLYNVTDYTNPVIMNGGNPVYTRSSTNTDWDWRIFNVGVTIDGSGTWHMLLEGRSNAGLFRLGYAYSDLVELDWSAHRSSSYVIDAGGQAGNPYLKYVPDRNALLALHGCLSGSIWKIVSSYASLSDDLSLSANWHLSPNFEISQSGIHVADPSAMFNFSETYPTMISYNHDQKETYQAYSALSLNEFYDALTHSLIKWQSTYQSLYSVSAGNLVLQVASPNTRCLNSKTNFNNYVVEARQKVAGSTPCELMLVMEESIATVTTKERTSIRLGDSFVVYINGAYSLSGVCASDTWYRSIIKVPSTGDAGAYIYSDDEVTLYESITGTPAYRTAYIGVYQGAHDYGYMDWIFVRKYASPDPTWGTSGGEVPVPVAVAIAVGSNTGAAGMLM